MSCGGWAVAAVRVRLTLGHHRNPAPNTVQITASWVRFQSIVALWSSSSRAGTNTTSRMMNSDFASPARFRWLTLNHMMRYSQPTISATDV